MATFVNTPNKVTYFAETDYRSKRIRFGIRDEDRERHMYVIGKTGMGKSTLLENLAIQDIANGEGLCFIDPHGGTAETLLSYIPEHRINDVIYFAPFDQEFPVALNVMEDIGRDKRPLVASGLIGAFKKVWVDAWSARMEYILSNALLALLEYPGATLLGVNRIFADKNYRSLIVNNVTDPSVKAFWLDEYAKYSDKFATEATAAIQNKVGQFAANPLIRNMVGQSKSTFDIRKVMDERKILIVNLSKGRMGEGNANLVGSMLITKIYLAAMSRADVGPEVVRNLPPFYLYVDEFQSFANESFADILSEARKYKLSLTVAHQYIEQMSDEVRAAVFGNVGSMVAFRVGAYDAEVLEKEFAPAFTAEDMVNLGFAQIYLRLMINGVGSSPFSATTLNRPKFPPRVYANEVIASSRAQFGRLRAEVEEEIKKWHEPVPEPARAVTAGWPPRDPNAPQIPETRKYAPGTRPLRAPQIGASAAYTGPRAALAEGVSLQQEIAPPTFRAPRAADSYERSPSGMYGTHSGAPSPKSIVPPQRRPVDRFAREREDRQIASTRASNESNPVPQEQVPSAGGGQVHQPFRDEFVKLNPIHAELPPPRSLPANANAQASKTRTMVSPDKILTPKRESAPEHVSQSPISPRQAALSSLKSQPKKDKGPSTENLSSLKALINAAFVHREGEAKTEIPVAPPRVDVSQKEDAGREKIAPQQDSSLNPPLADWANDSKVVLAAPTSPRVQPSLLDDVSPRPTSKEIPENVLRSVLGD